KGMLSQQEVPDRFSDRYRAGWVMRPWQIRAMTEDGATMIPAARSLRSRYRELHMPIAIIAGAGDKVADPDRQSRRLHSELAGSTLRVLAGYGHVVHYGGANAVLAAVDEVESRSLDKAIASSSGG